MQEKVIVLLSTYNGEKYLKEQIESVLNQKNVEVKILARDDGSTDNTVKILEEYKQQGKLSWYSGENLKPAMSFIDLMFTADESDYYAFCDQDDVWDDNKLEVAISKIKDYNDIPAMYYGSQKLVDEKLNFISIHKINTKRTKYASFIINNVAGCTVVFNKELLNKIKQHRPEWVYMHDNWTYKVCMSLGGFAYADENAYINYRQHGNNVEGLNSNFFGKVKRAKGIIFASSIKKNIEQLYNLYGNEMTEQYRTLCEWIIGSSKSIKNRFELLKNKDIDFKDKGLNLTFKLKVLLNKM